MQTVYCLTSDPINLSDAKNFEFDLCLSYNHLFYVVIFFVVFCSKTHGKDKLNLLRQKKN